MMLFKPLPDYNIPIGRGPGSLTIGNTGPRRKEMGGRKYWDFPGGPVIQNLTSNTGSIPD